MSKLEGCGGSKCDFNRYSSTVMNIRHVSSAVGRSEKWHNGWKKWLNLVSPATLQTSLGGAPGSPTMSRDAAERRQHTRKHFWELLMGARADVQNSA